jgi:hypothetical protein
MRQPDHENVRELADELRWLKKQAHHRPTHWAHSRIAEIEGILAAHHEEAAWAETRKVLKKMQGQR